MRSGTRKLMGWTSGGARLAAAQTSLDSQPEPGDDPGKAPAVSAHPLGQDDRLATSERPAGAPKTKAGAAAPLATARRALLVDGLVAWPPMFRAAGKAHGVTWVRLGEPL
jgi:hypothetical protein